MLKLLELLKNHWKIAGVVLLCLGFYVAGSKAHPGTTSIVYQDKIVEKQVEVEKKDDKDNVVTVITKKPDGSTTETITDHTEHIDNVKETDTKKESISEKTTTTAQNNTQNNYSLGLSVEMPLTLSLTDKLPPSYRVDLGRRVVWDLWIEASYAYHDNTLGVGFRYEF